MRVSSFIFDDLKFISMIYHHIENFQNMMQHTTVMKGFCIISIPSQTWVFSVNKFLDIWMFGYLDIWIFEYSLKEFKGRESLFCYNWIEVFGSIEFNGKGIEKPFCGRFWALICSSTWRRTHHIKKWYILCA